MCIKLAVKWFIAAEQEAYSVQSTQFLCRYLDEYCSSRYTDKPKCTSQSLYFFSATATCYDLKGNLDLSEMFLLNLMGGPVNQCGFHLLAHFTVNIHKNNFIEITAKGQARPNSAATFAHPSLKMG